MIIIIFLILISFLATLVRSTFGFGESLVAVPLFALLIPLNVAVPLSVLMSVLVALVVVIQDHQHIHIKSAQWLIVFALTGIPIGLAILAYGNAYWVKIFLGLLIAGNSIYTLQKKNSRRLEHDSKWWLFICGFLSGVLGGAYGINGPPLVVYGNMRQWSAAHFRATLQAYFLPVSLIAVAGYGVQGLLNWNVTKYFLFCIPAIIPAIFMGRHLNRKLAGRAFFRYVYWGLICIGIILIVFTLSGQAA
jgi:uncharacterized membrane protein YfcA